MRPSRLELLRTAIGDVSAHAGCVDALEPDDLCDALQLVEDHTQTVASLKADLKQRLLATMSEDVERRGPYTLTRKRYPPRSEWQPAADVLPSIVGAIKDEQGNLPGLDIACVYLSQLLPLRVAFKSGPFRELGLNPDVYRTQKADGYWDLRMTGERDE